MIPSNIVRLIAQQDHVLLGRYSVDRFSLLFFLTPLLFFLAYRLLFKADFDKKQAFQMIVVVLATVSALVIVDVLGRVTRKPRYREKPVLRHKSWPGHRVYDVVRHRPPDLHYRIDYEDKPPTARSYPDVPPGFPPISVTLMTDGRGFRNLTDLDQYDIVTVGDSFTEGSRVSDDNSWPVLLGKALGKTVYNLGVSGSSPRSYLTAYREFGHPLKPKLVIFMFYEGNDFRGDKHASPVKSFNETINETIKSSPIILNIKKSFIKHFGPINANATVLNADLLSWMPIAHRCSNEVNYYAFLPKRLTQLYVTPPQLKNSNSWNSTIAIMEQIKQLCNHERTELLFVYAPSKPHVVMPLVQDSIPAEPLRYFASLRLKNLPSAKRFKDKLYANLETVETAFVEYCRNKNIDWVSTTNELRTAMADGLQVYYTYNQHWTHLGHIVVAETLHRYLANSNTTRLQPNGAIASNK